VVQMWGFSLVVLNLEAHHVSLKRYSGDTEAGVESSSLIKKSSTSFNTWTPQQIPYFFILLQSIVYSTPCHISYRFLSPVEVELSLFLLTAVFLSINMSVHQRKPAAKVITDAVKKVENEIENALTVLWDDLPSWQQDNHFIHSGYRPASASFRRSFASLGYLHNESVNIYSHLVGAIGFTTAGIILYTAIKPRYESATPADCLAFGSFFLGAAVCLGMSATYHTISNHSPTVAKFGNKLDYVGIVSLITGSFIPTIYYGFYCHPHIQETYWLMVCEAT